MVGRIWLVLGAVLLVSASCKGEDEPEPCPSLPPCITGTTWNATVCACIEDDELPDASNKAHRDAGAIDASTDGDSGPS
jgi:hypothetical protein